ncbi:MAG: hypothetical protein QOD81_4074 [Solirubrobacteraceae bacterium]|nr:hypothetical protein [Solirubrobacteraceae bacterium]
MPGRAPLRPSRRRARVALLAAVVLVLVAAGAALVAPGPRRPAAVTVQPAVPGRLVPRSFLGLSMEWSSVQPFGAAARPAVVALLERLAAAARTPPALRVGGSSAEEAWWNPDGRPRPATVRHDVGPATLGALAALARALHAPVTAGLNLSLGDAPNALALARAARRRLGRRLEALELGNEPDLYTAARTTGPRTVQRLRKKTAYTPADYARDLARYRVVLRRGLRPPRPRLVAGGFAGRPSWVAALPGVLGREGGGIGALSGHRYALSGCAADPDADAERAALVSDDASRARMAGLRPLIALAHRHGVPLHVAELNSAPCGGTPGVSDTFAAAVWLTDALFALLREGADRVDVHTWDGAVYAPFARRGGAVRVRPPFYGMLAFARAAPRGSRLAGVRVVRAGDVRAWATVDGAGGVRLALIARGDRSSAVRVRVGRGRPCATVWLAAAPSLSARSGVAERRRTACPRDGAIAVDLPGPSLAVLTLPPAAKPQTRAARSAGRTSSP